MARSPPRRRPPADWTPTLTHELVHDLENPLHLRVISHFSLLSLQAVVVIQCSFVEQHRSVSPVCRQVPWNQDQVVPLPLQHPGVPVHHPVRAAISHVHVCRLCVQEKGRRPSCQLHELAVCLHHTSSYVPIRTQRLEIVVVQTSPFDPRQLTPVRLHIRRRARYPDCVVVIQHPAYDPLPAIGVISYLHLVAERQLTILCRQKYRPPALSIALPSPFPPVSGAQPGFLPVFGTICRHALDRDSLLSVEKGHVAPPPAPSSLHARVPPVSPRQHACVLCVHSLPKTTCSAFVRRQVDNYVPAARELRITCPPPPGHSCSSFHPPGQGAPRRRAC